MCSISRGIACRICRFNEEGVCKHGHTQGVRKPDECWTFQRKDTNHGLAENGEIRIEWRLQ